MPIPATTLRNFVAVLLVWASLPLQAQPAPDVSTFGEVIDVRVVNVEVVVTDKEGRRVTGLAPEDFRVTVDGEEVGIDFFTEVAGGRVSVPASTAATAVPPALTAGEPVGTRYLLFVDDFFSVKKRRNRVLERLVDDLSLLGPEDRVAVVSYDGQGLDMLANWTPPGPELRKTLDDALRRPAYGTSRRMELRHAERGGGVVKNRPYYRLLREQVKGTLDAAAASLRAFAQPPGRRVMLLLSGGWPTDAVSFYYRSQSVYTTNVVSGIPHALYELVSTANRLSYTLYPVDVQGVSAESPGDVERIVPDSGSQGLIREGEEHHSLRTLAHLTGGEEMLNSQRDVALERVVEDTRSYYWLGFEPSWREHNGDHRIEVEALRPGLKVRHRRGFTELTRPAETLMRVESALLFGDVPPGSGPLDVKPGKPKKAGFGKVHVPLEILVPLDRVTVLPQGDQHVARLELILAVIDRDGNQSAVPRVPIRLRVPEKPDPGAVGVYVHTILTRKEKQDLLTVIFDPLSGQTLARRLRLDP